MPAVSLDGIDTIIDHLVGICEAGDVVLAVSNADFGNIWRHLLDALGD